MSKNSFKGAEIVSRSPSPDRVSVANSEVSLPLTTIEKKQEHFFGKSAVTSSPDIHDDRDVKASLQPHQRVIKVDYRNTKEIEIVTASKSGFVEDTPTSAHIERVESSCRTVATEFEAKEPNRAGKGKIPRMMAKFVHNRLSLNKTRQTTSVHGSDFVEVKIPLSAKDDNGDNETTGIPMQVADMEDATTTAEVKELVVEKKSIAAGEETPVKEVLHGKTVAAAPPNMDNNFAKVLEGNSTFDEEVQRAPKEGQGWFTKVNEMMLARCNPMRCGDDVCQSTTQEVRRGTACNIRRNFFDHNF